MIVFPIDVLLSGNDKSSAPASIGAMAWLKNDLYVVPLAFVPIWIGSPLGAPVCSLGTRSQAGKSAACCLVWPSPALSQFVSPMNCSTGRAALIALLRDSQWQSADTGICYWNIFLIMPPSVIAPLAARRAKEKRRIIF